MAEKQSAFDLLKKQQKDKITVGKEQILKKDSDDELRKVDKFVEEIKKEPTTVEEKVFEQQSKEISEEITQEDIEEDTQSVAELIPEEVDVEFQPKDEEEVESITKEVIGSDTNNGKNTLFEGSEDISKDIVLEDGTIEREGVKGRYVLEDKNGVERRVFEPTEKNIPLETKNPAEIKQELDEKFKPTKQMMKVGGSTFETIDGDIIEPRYYEKGMRLAVINKDKIQVTTPIRKSESSLMKLQESIKDIGLLEPLIVVPIGIPTRDEYGQPDYESYILVHGRLRYEACLHLNRNNILCVVDATIPKELINIYMASYNRVQPYKFSEMLDRAELIREIVTTDSVSFTKVEELSGFETGDWHKGLFINEMKLDYPQYYNDVESGKLDIKTAYDKLNKEIDKKNKDSEKGKEEKDSDILEDKNKDELQEIQTEARVQKNGERQTLDPLVRREVEARDEVCKCCGYPIQPKKTKEGQFILDEDGKPIMEKLNSIVGMLQVEHLSEVQYGFSPDDVNTNLYLICANCHNILNNYRDGRYVPSKELVEENKWIQKILVAGNMKMKMKQYVITKMKKEDPDVFKKLEKGKTTLGKAVKMSKIQYDPMSVFGGNPLKVLFEEFDKIDADKESVYNDLEYMGEDYGDVQEIKHANPVANDSFGKELENKGATEL